MPRKKRMPARGLHTRQPVESAAAPLVVSLELLVVRLAVSELASLGKMGGQGLKGHLLIP